MLPLIDPPFLPCQVSHKGCVTDRLPEHRDLRGCRQFWEPGARCSSGGRTNSESVVGSHLDLGPLRPRGRDESIETACGWTLLGVFSRACREGVSAELFGVKGPSESSPVSVDPLKGLSPYSVQCDRDMLLRGRGCFIVPPRTLHEWC